uniref:TRI35 protein n=1 Tax=Sphenodon punctatus TaxID=8508 RepID=A0A8D0GVX4_SPHPU
MKKPAPPASSSSSPFKEELLCPICYDPFKEAVTLSCGHNFCKGCVTRSWRDQARHACPVCKETSAPADLSPNHTLNNIVEKLLKQEREQQQQQQGPAFCALHQEEARLFCAEDKELVCFACQSSKQHKNHKVCPIGEAAKDYRAKWKNMENSLRAKMRDFASVKRTYEAFVQHNQNTATGLEQQIKKQFDELHDFLRAEEAAMLAELQEEARQKLSLIKGKVKKLSEESDALLREVTQLQADLQEDDVAFLQKHKNRKRRLACTIEEPESILPGMLLEVTKYLGSLQYTVWKKMLEIIKIVPFSFDPNSAAGWLTVSDNLTSVAYASYKLVADNPERFTSTPCILCSRGFSKGFHTWEVEVDGIKNWRVGVAKRWDRPGQYFHHDARSGFWFIYRLLAKDDDRCQTSNTAHLEVSFKNLRRIRVELDCDEGELSFYNADQKSHIYTFHENFGGEVVPYFYVGSHTPDVPSEPLRICPLQVLVKENYPK